MTKPLKKILLASALLGALPVYAADLGTFTSKCGAGGENASVPIVGYVGDTFTIVSSTASAGGCVLTSTPENLVDPSSDFIPRGRQMTVTLKTVGTGTYSALGSGTPVEIVVVGTTFQVTVKCKPGDASCTPPPVASVPTVSEWSLMGLGLLAFGFGARQLKRGRKALKRSARPWPPMAG